MSGAPSVEAGPSRDTLQLLVDGLDAILWEAAADPLAFTFVSRGAERLLGYPVARWLESIDFWTGLIHPEDREGTLSACAGATGAGEDHRLLYRMVAADGRVVWIDDLVRVVTDASGRAVRLLGVMVDVTARREAELALARESAVSASMVRLARAILESDSLDDICHATLQEALAATGSPHGFTGFAETDGTLVAPAFTPGVMESDTGTRRITHGAPGLLGAALAARAPLVSNEAPADPRAAGVPSGHARIRRFLAAPAVHGDALVGVIAVANAARDYGPAEVEALRRMASIFSLGLLRRRVEEERVRVEDVVRQSSTDWRRTFDALAAAVLVLDGDGRVERLNRAAAEALAGSYASALGQPLASFGGEEPWRTAVRLVEDGGEGCRRVPDASGRWWMVSRTLMDEEGTPRTILVAEDVTALVELEASVRRAETMAAMGTLTGGVAHEVRNPLFAIGASVDALGAILTDRDDARQLLGLMRDQVARMNQLMNGLLAYGKPVGDAGTAVVPFARVLDEALASCAARAAQAGVTLTARRDERGASLRGDAERLVEVLANLLDNAIQHAPAGSAVTLAATREAERVRVTVEDEGRGFAAADLPRVFEPFFSRRKGGTGLGLSIAQRIAEQHGGRLVAANRAGGGACVTLELPLAPA